MGLVESYRSIFHAMAQIQGLMMCFAVGFLFTFIPRRTGAEPARAWEVLAGAALPTLTTALAWLEAWVWSQLSFLLLVGLILSFAARRLRQAGHVRPLHAGFVWVPVSLVSAVVASLVTGAAGAAGEAWMWLHDIGRGVLLQGLFTGLSLGIGGLLLPVLTRGEDPFGGGGPRAGRTGARWPHLAGAALLLLSFPLEHLVDLRAGFALRAAVVGAVLVGGARLHLRPTVPGLHRWLAWLSAWMLPAGYAAVAAFPEYRRAGLHLVFLGGFATMAFTVATHVALVHAGREGLLRRSPGPLRAMAALFAAALTCRIALEVDPARYSVWIGLAAGCFLAGTLAWAALVIPALLRSRSGEAVAPARG
jgi:uncharacterized protein involved in response to NO